MSDAPWWDLDSGDDYPTVWGQPSATPSGETTRRRPYDPVDDGPIVVSVGYSGASSPKVETGEPSESWFGQLIEALRCWLAVPAHVHQAPEMPSWLAAVLAPAESVRDGAEGDTPSS